MINDLVVVSQHKNIRQNSEDEKGITKGQSVKVKKKYINIVKGGIYKIN